MTVEFEDGEKSLVRKAEFTAQSGVECLYELGEIFAGLYVAPFSRWTAKALSKECGSHKLSRMAIMASDVWNQLKADEKTELRNELKRRAYWDKRKAAE